MKKGCLILMVGLLATTFTSCKKKEELKEPGAEKILIYMYDFEDWSNEYFKSAVDKYNDNVNDGVEIVCQFLDEDVYSQKVISSRESGKAADIYLVAHSNLWQEYVNKNLAPLDDILSKEIIEDYTDTALEASTLDGSIYSVPYCFEPSMLLFYSKSMFAQAGITKEPETYDEMLEACEKLSKVISKTQTVLGTPLANHIGWANVGQFYNAADGNLPISEDWSESLVATTNMDGYKEFLEYYSSLYNLGYASKAANAGGYNEIINELCEGRVAMTFAGSYAVGQIYKDYIEKGYLKNADDIGCCLAPRKNLDMGASSNGGWAFVLETITTSRIATNEKVKGKTHAELAADFLEWYTTGEQATGFFELGKCCKQTGFKSVQALLDKSQVNNPYYEVIKEAANNPAPLAIYNYEITAECSKMIDALISSNNKLTVEQIIGECHKAVTRVVETNKLAGKNPKSNG